MHYSSLEKDLHLVFQTEVVAKDTQKKYRLPNILSFNTNFPPIKCVVFSQI